MSKIQEEIEDLELKIKELKKLSEKENLKDAPDVIGKYFKPFGTAVLKIKSVSHYDTKYNEFNIECEEVNIGISSISVDTNAWYNEIKLDSEITQEEYYKWYDKAIEFINNLRNGK